MKHRLGGILWIKEVLDSDLAPKCQIIAEQLGLDFLDQFCHCNCRIHVNHSVMCADLLYVVCGSHLGELEYGVSVGVCRRPADSLWPEIMACTHQVNDVPSGVSVLPLTLIGVHEVPVQCIADELVIELKSVETADTGARDAEDVIYLLNELAFRQSLCLDLLRGYSGDHACGRVGDIVCGEPAVEDYRVSDWIQIHVGALSGELSYPVIERIQPERLKVIPEESLLIVTHISNVAQKKLENKGKA